MAKSFYSAQEAADRLGTTEEGLKDLVKKGKLREFRDAGKATYRVDDVDALGGASASASTSGEIVLEPAEESGIDLSASGSDILSLEEVEPADIGDTSAGTQTDPGEKKGSTVVPSVGVNVFDDDELDEAVDPLAQTAVTDIAGLGVDGVGSGSGILDLTRESDDTSLGAELLEEIYSGDEEGEEEPAVEMGEDTRAGLDEAVTEAGPSADEDFAPVLTAEEGRPRAAVAAAVEYVPDAVSTSLTALMAVAVLVMWFAGLAGAALVRGIAPSMIISVYEDLAIYTGAVVMVGVAAAAVTFFVAKRSG